MSAALVLSALGVEPPHRLQAQPQSPGPAASIAGTASPTFVDLRAIPPGTGAHTRLVTPFLYPGGQAALDREKAAARLLPPDRSLPQLATAAPGATTASSPSPGLGFDGIDDAESYCGCVPPDGDIAVSPNYILATVNTAFKIWDKSGNVRFGPTDLSWLFGGCLATYPNMSDPFTGYDAASQRFILGILVFDSLYNSSICMAASATSDPVAQQQWYVYSFPVGSSNVLLDFPRAAIASNAIYLGGNLFFLASFFEGSELFAYNKGSMYNGQPVHYLGYTISTYDTLTPARTVGLSSDPAYSSGAEYFTAADNVSCPCTTIRLWKWNAFSGAAPSYQGSVTVNSYAEPPNAVEPGGGTITTNDARELGAYWASDTVNGDTIYGAHTVGCNPGGGTVACVQWYQLKSLDTTPALVQQGIAAANGTYRSFPDLTVDSAGDMAIGYAYSSSTDYAGIRYTGRLAGDPLGTLESESVLKAGQTTIDGTRYGDYAGEAVDPDGCTIWHFEEYARSGSVWGTWTGSFAFPSCAGGSSTATTTPTGSSTPSTTPTASFSATSTPTTTGTAAPTNTPTATPTPTATRTHHHH